MSLLFSRGIKLTWGPKSDLDWTARELSRKGPQRGNWGAHPAGSLATCIQQYLKGILKCLDPQFPRGRGSQSARLASHALQIKTHTYSPSELHTWVLKGLASAGQDEGEALWSWVSCLPGSLKATHAVFRLPRIQKPWNWGRFSRILRSQGTGTLKIKCAAHMQFLNLSVPHAVFRLPSAETYRFAAADCGGWRGGIIYWLPQPALASLSLGQLTGTGGPIPACHEMNIYSIY